MEGQQWVKQGPVIAIDGLGGTGKSSAARQLAVRLGYRHIDTGACYRAVAWLALERGCVDQVDAVKSLAQELVLDFQIRDSQMRVMMKDLDLTEKIRTAEVTYAASRISALSEVRQSLLAFQRKLGCVGSTVVEGRDIGTVIFPDADLKFFLFADLEKRTSRRWLEMKAMNLNPPVLEELKSQLEKRDRADLERAVAPLKKAVDAIEIDTSLLSLDAVVDQMLDLTKQQIHWENF